MPRISVGSGIEYQRILKKTNTYGGKEVGIGRGGAAAALRCMCSSLPAQR